MKGNQRVAWGFEKGRVYNRQKDIHDRFGGQQRSGIITPANYRLVIAITGEEGLEHGYADRLRPDGVFEYFGEGQVGDMQMVRGNRAIARHSIEGRSLLLFRNSKDGLRLEGEMVVEGYHYRDAPDRDGNIRKAIVFELRQLEAINEALNGQPIGLAVDFSALRELAFSAAKTTPKTGNKVRSTVYERSAHVRAYVLARANGYCEGCGTLAPFKRKNGDPYLETHHLHRLSDGGPDHPAHVIALCPVCHCRIHYGEDGLEYNQSLIKKMRQIELHN